MNCTRMSYRQFGWIVTCWENCLSLACVHMGNGKNILIEVAYIYIPKNQRKAKSEYFHWSFSLTEYKFHSQLTKGFVHFRVRQKCTLVFCKVSHMEVSHKMLLLLSAACICIMVYCDASLC